MRRLIFLPWGVEPVHEGKGRAAGRRVRPVMEALSLPEDVLPGTVRLTVLGQGEVLCENHRSIAEVTQARIRLTAVDGLICVSGSHLALCDVRRASARIRGDIARIELPGGTEHEK